MKNLFRKQSQETILVIFLICFFGLFYWQTIMSLPLFGDATIHGANAADVLKGGWMSIKADYPPFYSFLMATYFAIFGEKGFNAVPFLGFLFLLLSTFLLIRQTTKNYYLGLLAIFLVACSQKIIFYSARMYQEILISALFIFTIYLLFKYVEERKRKLLFLLIFFTGITLSIKQQGLFILYSSIVFFFIVDFIRKKSNFKELLSIVFIPLLVGFYFYGVLFHTSGVLQPGSEEFVIFRIINTTGQKIFSYQEPLAKKQVKQMTQQEPLNTKLLDVEKRYSKRAFQRAENRHIWPTEVFTNFDKFNQANNLYGNAVVFNQANSFLMYASFFLLTLGFFYSIYRYKYYQNLITFSLIFLPINYILFSRNSDQQRYHMFLPIFVLTFLFIAFNILLSRIQVNKFVKLFIVVNTMIILFVPLILPKILVNSRWGQSQLYSPSIGGIASIREAGNWIDTHTTPGTVIGQQCGNETHYYSSRDVLGDWRIYFLNNEDLQSYFRTSSISYYVIYRSQIVDDNEWKIICWVPMSFYEKMESSFDKVYLTSKNDIVIYKIK